MKAKQTDTEIAVEQIQLKLCLSTTAAMTAPTGSFSKIDMLLDASDFCLTDRRVVDTLVLLRERNRFLRGLRSWAGFRQIGVEGQPLAYARGTDLRRRDSTATVRERLFNRSAACLRARY